MSATPPARPIRVLVIGAGPATVMMHLPVLAALRDKGEVVLVLICDIERERAVAARRKFGFLEDGGDGAAALEREDIDAVYIFGSAQLHHRQGMAALRQRKHLFVEKPIAPSYTMAREMAVNAAERGLIAAGGHNRRFYRSLREVRARAGKAGWRLAEAVFHKPENGRLAPFGARSWLSANGIHALDAMIYMMGGLPQEVTAFAGEAASAQPGVFSALMRWRDGAQGVFLCNNNAGSRREEYVFHGFGETCSITGTSLIVERDGAVETRAMPSIGDGFMAEHQSFLQAIRSGAEPPHSIAALAPSLFLAELIEAGFSGRVQLPQVMPLPQGLPMQQGEPTAAPQPGGRNEKCILIAQPFALMPTLAQALPHYRIVSIDDVRQSDGCRPDITAAILGRGSTALPPEILNKLPRLAIVGVMGLSLSQHAPEALLARGITLVNARAAYAQSAAEFALGLAILARRRAFISHGVMREGGWGTVLRPAGISGKVKQAATYLRPAIKSVGLEAFFLRLWRAAGPLTAAPGAGVAETRDLKGSTVGLIGWGAIAQLFAQFLTRAHARVLVYSENAAPEDISAAGIAPASLGEVLAADIVSLHRGLTKHTRHFLGAAELDKLCPGAILINVARGALIEPGALLARLARGDVFACLDTFDEEPLAASHPLRALPNVFLTSHIAGGSRDMHAAAAEEVVGKVAAYLNGEKIDSLSARQLRTMT
jgi:phosphoglycerate dehydrogenase-like enzyme/predicted dehydrogenase